jgi:hypothetical protein
MEVTFVGDQRDGVSDSDLGLYCMKLVREHGWINQALVMLICNCNDSCREFL